MQMTPEEICRHYQQAKDKAHDIGVLAELNATDKASIRAILIDGGLCPPDKAAPKRRVHRGAYDEKIAELAAQGISDKEIAQQAGCCPETIKNWRKRQEQKAAAPVPPDAGGAEPPASEAACRQSPGPEQRQTAGGDIYARLEAILAAVPADSAQSVREMASDLLINIFCGYISARLGLEVLHEQ